MPLFSRTSLAKLANCDERLQRVFAEVVRHRDCTILEGMRSKEAQQEAFDKGLSQKRPGESQHNVFPSRAVDVAPYPIDWKDEARFYYFAGFVCGVASRLGVKLRWGGDWDSDGLVKDQAFMDLVHFEVLD